MFEIEGFTLQAAILHECQIYLEGGKRGGGGAVWEEATKIEKKYFSRHLPPTIPDACPLGSFENQDGRH